MAPAKPKPPEPKNVARRVDEVIQLGALYIQQRRLDEAEKLFRSQESAKLPVFQALARIGRAVVLELSFFEAAYAART